MSKKKVAIFDIDDTVFISKWVWAALKSDCNTFTECYKKHGDLNIPIKSTINLIKQLYSNNILIKFVTARPKSDFAVTEDNLIKCIGKEVYESSELFMVGYSEGINERKKSIIMDIKKEHDILFFMDDDYKNREAVASLGVLSLDILERI